MTREPLRRGELCCLLWRIGWALVSECVCVLLLLLLLLLLCVVCVCERESVGVCLFFSVCV